MPIQLRRITSSSHRYIPEIDGLRFIAIFSVLFFHVLYTATHVKGIVLTPSPFTVLFWPLRHGSRGVQLFFVISGFILGLPFAAHHLANERRVDVSRYFLRRLTRLEPPYVVALFGVYAAAILLRTAEVSDPDFISSLLLRLGYAYSAVHGKMATLNGVTWTLEIEVQFYILVPVIAKLFGLPQWARRAILIAIISLNPVIPWGPRCNLTLIGFVHFFLMGLLLADIHVSGTAKNLLPSFAYNILGIGGLLASFLIPATPVFAFFFPWFLGAVFISALRGGSFRTALRRPVIAVVGGMCYSLYLLHYPILSFIAEKMVRNEMPIPTAVARVGAVGLPIAVGAGMIYYIILERPCMNPKWPQTLYNNAAAIWSHLGRKRQPIRRSG